MKNFYEILELDRNASEQEIAEKIKTELSKWRKRVNAPDPKKQREASERMELLQAAEGILLNPANRNQYDHELFDTSDQKAAQDYSEPYQQEYYQNSVEDEVEYLLAETDRLMNQQNYADAIIAARKATELNGNNAYAWGKLALAHYYWGDLQDAIYEINRAINIQPNESGFYYNAYIFHINRTDIDFDACVNLAAEAIEKARKLLPGDPDYIIGSANIAKFRGHTQRGIQLLEELQGRQSLSPHGKEILAQLYCDKGISYTVPVDYTNGDRLHYFTDKDKTLQAKETLTQALNYAQDRETRERINYWTNIANNALVYKYNFKILAFLLIIVPMLLIGLKNFDLITVLISGGLGYLVWKKGRVPQYELNRKYIKSLN
ncbi:J domain-containing protein [Lederbergia galactosidilytica]|uniref:J domain-containing protein n=1 Tax=Lederbergia galactosidilytica TaxID=217031 RepID=A0A0Q9YHB0_9BACI|nr:DnaJ domain-containing protein [Lederbergia galactosidilytica]KRG16970.1 hypothetical protein ACA29_01500 [Lederbergia galactosidilytica]OAK70771.1 hypothetical protein ABB05_11715 [Lederbergia galactosidilytica]